MLSTTMRALHRLLVACALLVALTVAMPGAAQAVTAPAATPPAPVVVLGIPGLTWEDVTPQRMPALSALAARGGTGSLVVRTIHDTTCPVDGWLTLGAGARATAAKGPCAAPAVPDKKGVVPGWATYRTATRDSLSGAHLGSLAAALTSKTTCAAAVGPGAGVALAGLDGQVTRYGGAFTPAAVTAATARCGTVVVDLGAVRSGPTRSAQVSALDARIGQALAAAGPSARVIAASLADHGDQARLRPLVVHAPGLDGRALSSGSTRQDGLVLLTDLAPTITSMRGATAPTTWTGHAVRAGTAAPTATRLADARDLDLLGRTVRPLIAPFVTGVIAVALLALAALLIAWRTGALAARTARGAAAGLVTVVGAVPAATFLARLVPWWRTGSPGLAVTAVTLGIAAVIGALAWAGPWRRHPAGPVAVVALATIATLVADVATGSHLTISSMMGEHPVVGGRFYGLGNVSSGLLAAATLLLMAAVIEVGIERDHQRLAAIGALVLGLAVVVVTAAPQLGADFGGPAALLPAVLYLALRGTGLRLNAGRLAALGVVTAALLAVACLLDWLRPEAQRTHLGRFADTVINGGGGDIIGRKLIQNWTIFSSSWWTMLIPVLLAAFAYVVWRPTRMPRRPLVPVFEAQPLLRIGLLAVVVMLAIAFVLNDSGATVPAPVSLLVLPLAIEWALRARRP